MRIVRNFLFFAAVSWSFLISGCGIDNTDISSVINLSKVNGSVTEGGTLVFKVSLTSALYADIDVPYQVAGSGNYPADSSDFASGYPGGTVTLKAGRKEAEFTVLTANDTVLEQTEQLTVSLVVPSQVIAGTLTSIAGTIDDDTSNQSDVEVTVSAKTGNVSEGDGAEFTFALSQAVEFDVHVAYSVSGQVDAADFGGILPSGTATISSGSTTTKVVVTPIVDAAEAGGEDMTMNLDSVSDLIKVGTPAIATVKVND